MADLVRLEKGLANIWGRKKITKRIHAGRGQETKWSTSIFVKQHILKVKMSNGKTYIISNTNTDFCMLLENNIAGIGVNDPDIYKDTKIKLKNSTLESLNSLQEHLKEQIENNPDSYENKDLVTMLKAITELIKEQQNGERTNP